MPWYGTTIKNQHDGTAVVDWDTDTIKVTLHTATYAPDKDAHDFFNDITNEITGTGYTAGGITLSGKSVVVNAATDTVRFLAANISWTTATFTARYAVVRKDTGTATTSPVICYFDFGSDQSVSNGTFAINWDATDGVAKITY